MYKYLIFLENIYIIIYNCKFQFNTNYYKLLIFYYIITQKLKNYDYLKL